MPTDIHLLINHFGEAEIDKRIQEIDAAMRLFKQKYTKADITFASGSAEMIAITYFEWMLNLVKIFLNPESKADAFKIAACTELVITLVQPILNEPERRKLNAEFGMFCALTVIKQMKNLNFIPNTGRLDLDNKLHNFFENHLRYMQIIDCEQNLTLPIIATAAMWEILALFEEYRFQAV
jgi:hypothetical protein